MEKKRRDTYQKIIMTFSEPKVSNRKILVKNISFTTFYVIMTFITFLSFIYLGWFNFITDDPTPTFLSDSESKTVFYFVMALTTCFAFFVVKPRVVNRSLYFCIPLFILAFIGMFLTKFLQQHVFLRLIPLIILAGGTGFIVSAALLAFIYTLNSAERLFSTVALILGIVFYYYLQRLAMMIFPTLGDFYLPLAILVILYVSIFFVDSSDFAKMEIKNEKISYVSVSIMVIIVSMVIMNQATNSAIKESISQFSEGYFYVGAALALIIGTYLLRRLRYGLIISSIVWLFLVLGAHQLGISYLIFGRNNFTLRSLEVMLGMNSSMGMMVAIMMVGKVFEDKANFNMLRVAIIFIATALVSSSFLTLGLQGVDLIIIHTAMQLISFWGVVVFVGFTIYAFMKILATHANKPTYASFDSQVEPSQDPEEVLTTKEILVFDLLISGATLRQISGELKMKYDTVNFHYKNIYRKLEVNSKVELIVRYGKR